MITLDGVVDTAAHTTSSAHIKLNHKKCSDQSVQGVTIVCSLQKQQKSGTSASTCALTTHPSHPSVSILPRSSPLAISCSSERWEPPARSSPPSILHPFSRHRRNVQVWLVERLHTLSLPLGMGSMPPEVDARVSLHSMICDLFLLSMGNSTHTEGPAPPYLAEGFTSKWLHICPPRFAGWIERLLLVSRLWRMQGLLAATLPRLLQPFG